MKKGIIYKNCVKCGSDGACIIALDRPTYLNIPFCKSCREELVKESSVNSFVKDNFDRIKKELK